MNFDNQSYIYLTINDVNILINPSGGNAQNLLDKYKFCDILLSNGTLENSNLILSSYGIISADLSVASQNISTVAREKRLPIATAGNGNIIIDFKSGRNISIKRMV